MVKVRYTGDSKISINWSHMGKTRSFSVSPNQIIKIQEFEVPYILSYGKFQILPKDSNSQPESQKSKEITRVEVKDKMEKIKESPIIKEIHISSTIDTSQSKPVVKEEKVKETVKEIKTEMKEEKKEVKVVKDIDYTKLKKAELKKICKVRGLSVEGHRDDLIARCVKSDE